MRWHSAISASFRICRTRYINPPRLASAPARAAATFRLRRGAWQGRRRSRARTAPRLRRSAPGGGRRYIHIRAPSNSGVISGPVASRANAIGVGGEAEEGGYPRQLRCPCRGASRRSRPRRSARSAIASAAVSSAVISRRPGGGGEIGIVLCGHVDVTRVCPLRPRAGEHPQLLKRILAGEDARDVVARRRIHEQARARRAAPAPARSRSRSWSL